MTNEIEEIEFNEAVEITNKNKTKFIWLGNEDLDQIAKLLKLDSSKLLKLMPMEIVNSSPETINYLSKHVLVCYRGNTSKMVAKTLKSKYNIDTYSLKGGITKIIGEVF